MKRTAYIFIVLMPALLFSCIKPFQPKIGSKEAHKYVISGQVTSDEGFQAVSVSITSALDDPKPLPVSGCQVQIRDDQGNVYSLDEASPGNYLVWMFQDQLVTGSSYKVRVIIPEGDIIESAYEKMSPCPAVGPVYYHRKDIPTSDPANPEMGIQFYTDLDATGLDTRYYRWELVETWEYRSRYPIEWWYDGTVHHTDPPDYSLSVCWSTDMIQNIFTLSTLNFEQNLYTQFPLHFVNNRTTRLAYGYSLMVNQFSLSETAYNYWDQLRINSSQQGGLYTSQPLAIKGNLTDLTNSDKQVLGFFGASAVAHKRIFVSNVEDLVLDYPDFCGAPSILPDPLSQYPPDQYPIYFLEAGNVLNNTCVDCRILGGTNVKPDFWPN